MAHTILVADDSKTIRRAIEIAFEKEAFDVVSVADGNAAVAKAKEMSPDVVLADHAMPGQDGYAVAQALKGDPSTANIPVLLLSGTAAPFDEAKCTASGATGHIKKPFECTQLVNRVRQAVGEDVPELSGPAASPFAHLKPVSTGPITPKPAGGAGPAANPFAANSAPPPGQTSPFAAESPITPAAVAPSAPARPDPFGLGAPAQPAVVPAAAAPVAAVPAAAPVAAAPVAAAPVAAAPAAIVPAAAPVAPAAAVVAQAAPQVSAQLAAAGVAPSGDVNAATREIIERVVWEVVPELAETIIREEIARLLADK